MTYEIDTTALDSTRQTIPVKFSSGNEAMRFAERISAISVYDKQTAGFTDRAGGPLMPGGDDNCTVFLSKERLDAISKEQGISQMSLLHDIIAPLAQGATNEEVQRPRSPGR